MPGRLAALGLIALLGACAEPPAPYRTAPLPEVPGFVADVPTGHTRFDNASIARTFITLIFDLENGRKRVQPVRYDGPVKVKVVGEGSAQYLGFIDTVLQQIRREAGIDIARGDDPANLLIRFEPAAGFARIPDAACFVVTGRPDLARFASNPVAYSLATFKTGTAPVSHTVLLPMNLEPHAIRACIIEEVTQALGTVNDLFDLSDTIFNDDDAHIWPTRLDYLFLRLLYHPRMQIDSGRGEMLALAASILDEINPEGRAAPPLAPNRPAEFLDWRDLRHEIARETGSPGHQVHLASRLVRLAAQRAPASGYHCEALTTLASVRHRAKRPDTVAAFDRAIDVCSKIHGADDIRIAQLRLNQAFTHIRDEDYAAALVSTDGLEAQFRALGQDHNLTALYVVRLRAHILSEGGADTASLRQQMIAWGAYAVGDDNPIVEGWRLR